MNKIITIILSVSIAFVLSCKTPKAQQNADKATVPFSWENATVYFMLTDRFYNGDKTNDFVAPTDAQAAPYRGYMGGDVKGITQKINEGYFDSLGVNVIWMTPLIENIIGSVDEGTGRSYGFHGYWAKDWTAYDKRIGTKEDIAQMVKTAHQHGIRVMMDVVINHTGPVTPMDTKWPDDWVKTGPRCVYKGFESTVNCTLVDNLPDVKTESTSEVALPSHLIEKWKAEGRYDQEVKELDDFFATTKHPRRPYYYIVKWTLDLIKDFGIDGYRVDTAKHTEADVWNTLYNEAKKAFADWKKNHPDEKLDDNEFFMMGEVYNYFIGNGRMYDYNDKKVDFFGNGFNSLINFDFKGDAHKSYDSLFAKYDTLLHGPLTGKTVLNYISSHDDGGPFDKERKHSIESATKLLLTQGGAQIYYGDETARSLSVEAQGDAVLRSFMNWDEINNVDKQQVLKHWQKIGKFRKNHPSVGAGRHTKISDSPYAFSRSYDANGYKDNVVVALDVNTKSEISVASLSTDGEVRDAYSGDTYKVKNGKITINPNKIYLFEKI
jgi:alpha-amylase